MRTEKDGSQRTGVSRQATMPTPFCLYGFTQHPLKRVSEKGLKRREKGRKEMLKVTLSRFTPK